MSLLAFQFPSGMNFTGNTEDDAGDVRRARCKIYVALLNQLGPLVNFPMTLPLMSLVFVAVLQREMTLKQRSYSKQFQTQFLTGAK